MDTGENVVRHVADRIQGLKVLSDLELFVASIVAANVVHGGPP